jgi:hypothetical protein
MAGQNLGTKSLPAQWIDFQGLTSSMILLIHLSRKLDLCAKKSLQKPEGSARSSQPRKSREIIQFMCESWQELSTLRGRI